MIDKAVSIGLQSVWATAHVSVARCAGHFPDRPIIPLIRMCEAAAQTGVVLVGLNGTPEHAPIAVGSGESKALTSTFVEPPSTLLIHARKIKQRMSALFFVDADIFVDGQQVAHLSSIKYLLPKRKDLIPSLVHST